MSFMDDYLRQQQGASQAKAAGTPHEGSYIDGFIGSALSAIPELFGTKPTAEAQQFRNDNPWSGTASSLIGSIVPYALTDGLVAAEGGAALLDKAMTSLPGVRGLTAVDNPIVHGFAKATVRYAPVELARLGVGLGTTDSWHDYGNLMADVGLSTLITGGFGGLGGFFRVGGPALATMDGVRGAPVGLKPTFELRMSKGEGAETTGKMSLGDVQQRLTKEVFQETPYKNNIPGQKQEYVQGLEGGNPETDALMNALFRPASGKTETGLSRQPLMRRDGTWALDEGAMKTMLGAVEEKSGGALKTTDDLAENMVFPRLLTAKGDAAAGNVSKALKDSAMQIVAPGVMAGKEALGGLHVMAVRVRAGVGVVDGIGAEKAASEAATMYHGTDGDFTRIDLGAPAKNNVGSNVAGSFFTPDPLEAANFGKRVIAAKLDVRNPFKTGESKVGKKMADAYRTELQATNAHLDPVNDSHWFEKKVAELKETKRVSMAALNGDGQAAKRVMQAGGYDGHLDGRHLVPFEDRQIMPVLPSMTTDAIRAGDQWLLFKTDKPHLFAPDGYKLAKMNVERFSFYNQAFQKVAADDLFNKDYNLLLDHFTPDNFKTTMTKPKVTAISEISKELQGRIAETAGLTDSATLHSLAEHFYDIMAPTVVNERRNPLFARLFGTLRSSMKLGDATVNKLIGGDVKVRGGIWTRRNLEHTKGIADHIAPLQETIHNLSLEELQDLKVISDANAPMDKLADYTANGMVSDDLRTAVEQLQEANKWVWENHLSPAFKNSNVDGKFDLLNGYIMPRMWTGDHFAPVLDEAGNMVWLANGSRRLAMKHAQMVVDEAAAQGRKLTIKEPYMVGAGKPADQINDLHDLVQMQMGKDASMQEIVQRAMKKMQIDRAGTRKVSPLANYNGPRNLIEKRTGIAGSADIQQVTHQDVIKALEGHYKQLYRFAGYSAWKNRFMPEAINLAKQSPVLAEDLRRKSNQMMGYEGQITASLNKALAPVLGQFLGSKPATAIATKTNALLYSWNLSIANPTFALLNVLQPIQTVLPHLAFLLHAPTEAIERDMHMTLRFGADGLPREVVGVLDPARILGRALKLMGKPDETLMEHLGRAKTDGTLTAQLFEDYYGGQSRGVQTLREGYDSAGGGMAGGWEVIKRSATFAAERSEEVSRGIAFNSYYILGKDYFGLEGDKLYRFMQRGTHNSMFGYSLLDRSRMFTGPIGSTFGLFKNWQMHFISSMFQYADLGWKTGAWSPMLWQFGVAGAVGGLGAMGPLKWIADGLSRWHGDDKSNSYLWMQEHWHDSADELYFGLPALFGASLQASSILPGTDVRNDITSLSSFVFWERAKAAGKATGAAWDYAQQTGQDPLRIPQIRDQLMGAFAPRAFFRAFSSVEGDYTKSMSTGNPSARGISNTSKYLYAMGLNQVQIEEQQRASQDLYKDHEARKLLTQQLGIQLLNAEQNKDYEGMQAVTQTAISKGLEPSSVYRSMATRRRRQQSGSSTSQYANSELAQRYDRAFKP